MGQEEKRCFKKEIILSQPVVKSSFILLAYERTATKDYLVIFFLTVERIAWDKRHMS